MDVKEFVCGLNRMCGRTQCKDCKIKTLHNIYGCNEIILNNSLIDKVVEIVQEWNDEHPVKTHLSVFLEHYPNCKKHSDGRPRACVTSLYGTNECAYNANGDIDCWKCWNTPIEGE